MKKILAFVAIALIGAISQNSGAAEFSKDELFAAGLVLHAVDYAQTMGISKSCHNGGRFHETNPLLGRCPSASHVGKYFLATAAAMAVIHYSLKTSVPAYVWIAVEAGATANNARIGISMRF